VHTLVSEDGILKDEATLQTMKAQLVDFLAY
jgi:hypothetical protein